MLAAALGITGVFERLLVAFVFCFSLLAAVLKIDPCFRKVSDGVWRRLAVVLGKDSKCSEGFGRLLAAIGDHWRLLAAFSDRS